MSTMMTKPTQKELLEYLSYDADTGILTWIKKPSKKIVLNSRAGSQTETGYRTLYFKGKKYQEHHVIWCIVHGQFPTMQIDHIDQDRSNNAINNLREVSQSENSRNRARARRTRLGEVGIWWCRRRRKYVAEITLNRKKVYQKTFDDIDDAIRERKAKALELGFHENHGNKLK